MRTVRGVGARIRIPTSRTVSLGPSSQKSEFSTACVPSARHDDRQECCGQLRGLWLRSPDGPNGEARMICRAQHVVAACNVALEFPDVDAFVAVRVKVAEQLLDLLAREI
jgi:hypothetical protein